MTLIMSNVGNVILPEVMSNKIERIEIVSGDARVYNMPMFFYIMSMNGYMNITFGLSGKDRRLCKEFYRILSSMGISVRIESSLENGIEDNTDVAPKMCNKCHVRIGEEYSRCPLCDSAALITDKPDEYFKTALFAQPYKKYVHVKRKKKNIFSIERLKAYFLTNP